MKYTLKNNKTIELRPLQEDALKWLMALSESDTRHALLNAPTGTGKSIIAMVFAERYKSDIDNLAKIDIISGTNYLLKQYSEDFSHIQELKGKNNYNCQCYGVSCELAQLIYKKDMPCEGNCVHQRAVGAYVASDISLTNFNLWTIHRVSEEINMHQQRKPRVLIIDEAHDFEITFCDSYSVGISESDLRLCGFLTKEAKSITKQLHALNTPEKLTSFFESTLMNILVDKIKELSAKVARGSIGLATQKGKCIELERRLLLALTEYKIDKLNWVVENGDNYGLLKPVWGFKKINDFLNQYDFVVHMSATLPSTDSYCKSMGIDKSTISRLDLPCPFDKLNRKIVYFPLGKLSAANKESILEIYKKYIPMILKKHKNQKGVIHTVSYEYSQFIQNNIPDPDKRFIFHGAGGRDQAILNHKESKEPTILISPSVYTGVDFKDDYARFQICFKVPFPYLGDPRIKRRMTEDKMWYSSKTAIDIIQSFGRGVRSIDDKCVTYVLDSFFSDLMINKLIPEYICEAIEKITI